MKTLINILLVLILVASFASFISPDTVFAGEEKEKKVEKEVLGIDEVRLDKNTKIKKVKDFEEQGVKRTEYTAVVSTLPETLDDLVTKITLEWRPGRGIDGVDYLVTGNNLYWARVTKTRVSVEYESKLAAWDPQIIIDGQYLELISGPTVIADLYNSYYTENTVRWVYEGSTGGIFGIGARTLTMTRYLRQIEGLLQEYYVLDEDPSGDVQIKQNFQSEKGFKWDRPVSAWDADHNLIEIEDTEYGKIVKAGQLYGRTYPVTIDPTVSFTTSSYDADWDAVSGTYSTVREAASASLGANTVLWIGQVYEWGSYWLKRSSVFFNTSTLGAEVDITSGYLAVFGYGNFSDTDFSITIQSGMPTYPHMPPTTADYYYLHYSGDGGSFNTSGFSTSGYNNINLNATGRGWINKTGQTKFMLRSSREISGYAPGGEEYVGVYPYEQGTGYQPKLVITYSVAVTAPEAQTDDAADIVDTYATLHGTVVDDGNATTSVQFKYGTSTGVYPYASPWQSPFYTDDTFYDTVYGLSKGTKHFFVARVANSHSSVLGDEETFLTKPGNPSGFTATPGDEENALGWTKGTGANKTLIRFKTTGYPTSTSDGTQVYFDTGVSYDHTSLDNGTPYFYSAWAYTEDGVLTQYSLGYVTATGTPVFTGPPLVTTNPATDVTQTNATLHGYLDSLSGYGSADVWFQYYKGAGSWTDNETTPDTLTATGAFSKAIATLDADTLYHMRAAATGTGGTTYGSDIPFTTGAISAPTMTTQAATGVTMTNATLHGKVTDDGGAVVTAWFEWGLTEAYGYTTNTASGLYTDDTIYASLIDLDPGSPYHFRIVGENSAGTSYGGDLSFETDSPTSPTTTTQDATSVGATSATLHGTVTSDGGVAVEVRFQYGTTDAYGTDTGWMPGYYTNDTFEYLIIDLDQGESYNFRAQVKNITATGSGADKEFETQFGPPNEFKSKAVSPTSVTVSWGNVGDQTGVFAKRGSFPADRLDGDQVYFGPAESASQGNLSAGNTYFYRAWSWKDGDVWSEGYAEDATTTMTLIVGEVPAYPDIVGDEPPMPEDWFGPSGSDPTGEALEDWPFYDIIEEVATDTGIPSGSLWLVLTMVGIAVIGLVLFMMSGSLLVVLGGVGAAVVFGASMDLLPLWILFAFIVIGGSFAYFQREAG